MKIVFDSNVIIAAFAARGLCQAVFELCLGNHEMVLSEVLLVEIERGLKKKIGIPASMVSEIVSFLKTNVNIDIPIQLDRKVCRDPDDVAVLGLAVGSRADCIVTGDADLLTLKAFHGVPIFSPRDFWRSLQGERLS